MVVAMLERVPNNQSPMIYFLFIGGVHENRVRVMVRSARIRACGNGKRHTDAL
jgi:hypothetical protein